MENIVIATPNGYKVQLRPWISYPKYIEIQKDFTANITVDPKDNQPVIAPFSVNLSLEVEEKLMRYLIVSIVDKDDNEVDNSEDYLPLPPEDCMLVKEEIDKISNHAAETFSKKK